MSIEGHAGGMPGNPSAINEHDDVLGFLFDIESGVEKGPEGLRRVLSGILGRIIEKRIGYYILPPDDYEPSDLTV